jgi:hydrogenase maturation protease
MKTLLLGMGNPILSDDAVGIRLATEIGQRLAGTPNLTVYPDCSVGGLELLDVLCGYDRAIIIDAIRTVGGEPGQWHGLDACTFRDTLHLTNIHDANFATALELGRRLGMPLPPPARIHIFAVEARDITTFSERMTPGLERQLPILTDTLCLEICRLLARRPPRAVTKALTTCRQAPRISS